MASIDGYRCHGVPYRWSQMGEVGAVGKERGGGSAHRIRRRRALAKVED